MAELKSLPNLSKAEFNRVLKQVPTTVVEVLIKTEKGIILGRRNTEPFKGMWHIPGGFINYNERIADAVKRVARRETGADVEIVKPLGIYEYINADPRGHMIAHAHVVKIVGGGIAPNPDNSELQFFAAPPEDMIFYQKRLVEDACR